MVGGVNLNVWPAKDVIANFNSIAIENDAAKIHVKFVTYINIAAVVAVKRRLDFNVRANFGK